MSMKCLWVVEVAKERNGKWSIWESPFWDRESARITAWDVRRNHSFKVTRVVKFVRNR